MTSSCGERDLGRAASREGKEPLPAVGITTTSPASRFRRRELAQSEVVAGRVEEAVGDTKRESMLEHLP